MLEVTLIIHPAFDAIDARSDVLERMVCFIYNFELLLICPLINRALNLVLSNLPLVLHRFHSKTTVSECDSHLLQLGLSLVRLSLGRMCFLLDFHY